MGDGLPGRLLAVWMFGATVAIAQVTAADVNPGALTSAADTRKSGITVAELGKTAGGASIPTVLVGLAGDQGVTSRPRLLIVAGMHPDHAASVLVAQSLGGALLDLAATDAALRALLERHAVEIVPCLAIDAIAAARQNRVFAPGRANLRAVDDDRDGVADEDGPDDLDGDGVITQMRVRDPLGEWRISDEDPRLLAKVDRQKGEAGTFRLESEGVDADADGAIDEDPPGGVDFDRNFAHGWKEFDRRTGTSAVSEPETRALIDHVLAHRNIAAVIVLGHRDSLVEVPPVMKGSSPVPDGLEADDRKLFEAVSDAFKKRTSFARALKDPPDGAFHQWAYFQFGVPAFAAKVYEMPAPPQAASQPASQPASAPATQPSGKKPESDDAKRLLDSTVRLGGKGFVAWRPFRHPTLGDVEIGGFVPMADVTPTIEKIPDLVRAHAQFAFDLLAMLPTVSLHDVRAKALGGGVHEITAVVRNDGRFPTILRMGTRSRSVMPSRVVVDLPSASFELGERQMLIEALGAGGDGRKLRWIVRAAPGSTATVSVWTEKAGRASATVTFGPG